MVSFKNSLAFSPFFKKKKKKKDMSSYIFKILRKYQGEINGQYLLSSKTKNALDLEISVDILNFMRGPRDVTCNMEVVRRRRSNCQKQPLFGN